MRESQPAERVIFWLKVREGLGSSGRYILRVYDDCSSVFWQVYRLRSRELVTCFIVSVEAGYVHEQQPAILNTDDGPVKLVYQLVNLFIWP